MFRSGAIEGVEALMLRRRNSDDGDLIPSTALEKSIIGSLASYLALLKNLAVSPPVFVALSDADEPRGFALIFKGSMQGIRNPKAHAPFEELDERRALDYLGLASLLMRRLDDVEIRAEPRSP